MVHLAYYLHPNCPDFASDFMAVSSLRIDLNATSASAPNDWEEVCTVSHLCVISGAPVR